MEIKNRDSFINQLEAQWSEGKFLSLGLDTDYALLPSLIKTESVEDSVFRFNKSIIDKTFDVVCAYKLNSAFYEAYATGGWKALAKTVSYIKQTYPSIPVILDAKRGDTYEINQLYMEMAFNQVMADSLTIVPSLFSDDFGASDFKPFMERKDKGFFVVVRTSNPGSEELQKVKIGGKYLYQIIAEKIASEWNYNGNFGVVAPGTYPADLKLVRQAVGNLPILIPGIGSQGGNLKKAVQNGRTEKGDGFIINSSRAIIYASKEEDYAEAADKKTREFHNQIIRCL